MGDAGVTLSAGRWLSLPAVTETALSWLGRGAHPANRAPVAPPLEGGGDERRGDDEEDRDVELVLEDGEGLAEDVAVRGDDAGPECGADGRRGEEPSAVHPAHAGDDGDEGPDDGDEPADDEGLVAVPLEEGVGLVEVLLLEEAPVPVVERRTDGAPDLVSRTRYRRRPRRRAARA